MRVRGDMLVLEEEGRTKGEGFEVAETQTSDAEPAGRRRRQFAIEILRNAICPPPPPPLV